MKEISDKFTPKECLGIGIVLLLIRVGLEAAIVIAMIAGVIAFYRKERSIIHNHDDENERCIAKKAAHHTINPDNNTPRK